MLRHVAVAVDHVTSSKSMHTVCSRSPLNPYPSVTTLSYGLSGIIARTDPENAVIKLERFNDVRFFVRTVSQHTERVLDLMK